MNNLIETTIENLKKNNMDCIYCENQKDVINQLDKIIKDESIVATGGSLTLNELGIFEYLRNRKLVFLDRYQNGLSSSEINDLFRKTFFADYYLTSSNAITSNGELYNVDGRGNRVAAMLYGPDKVIVVAGINKIVKNIDEAILRVKKIAAPKNAKRLNIETPCVTNDDCINCSDNTICRKYVVIKKPNPNRIIVILVNDNLGY